MQIKDLFDLIMEHSLYCGEKYQPSKLPHLTMDQALKFQNEMTQSLSHFGLWIGTVKLKEDKDE